MNGMLLKEKIGSLKDTQAGSRHIDYIHLHWHETAKKILHKKTSGGLEIRMKFFNETESLQQDDIVYADEELLICIEIVPVKAMVLMPASMEEMARICYELGNKHLPLFYENGQLAMPYEAPVFNLLLAAGYQPVMEERKLLQPMKTSVTPHGHNSGGSLFSKILQLTKPADES